MLKVVVGHRTRPTTLLIHTPIRKESVKRIARRSYPSLISELAKSSAVNRKLMIKAVTKHTKKEMKKLSRNYSNTVFSTKYKKDFLTNFSWETLWTELTTNLPSLMAMLSGLVRDVNVTNHICLSHILLPHALILTSLR